MQQSTHPIPPEAEGVIGIDPNQRATIRFERVLAHPIDRVWQSITEPDQMEMWLAVRARVDLRVGGHFDLWLGASDSEAPVSSGTITTLDAPRRIDVAFTDGSTLSWQLHAEADATRLVFIDTRPPDERARNSVLAGWHIRVDHLPRALDGTALDWPALDADRNEHGYVRPMAEIYWHYRNRPRPS
ncbi:MAG: SRPBCC domain-containing protein [Actinomycetota bacterium]